MARQKLTSAMISGVKHEAKTTNMNNADMWDVRKLSVRENDEINIDTLVQEDIDFY